MPIIPVRNLGSLGLITDINPQDLPLVAWTDARNVRFSEGSVSRYSVFKLFDESYTYQKRPVGVIQGGQKETDGKLVTIFHDGSMEEWYNDTTTDVTPTGTLGDNTDQITTCRLGGLTYVHRPSDIPVYRDSLGYGNFEQMTSWDSEDRCESLRAYKDFLIALNVTKSNVHYPTMVKWSDATQAGQPPTNWDYTDDSSLAGENVLNDADGPIVDGGVLGDAFIIYTETETFRMDYIGGGLLFRTQKLFSDQGAISKNCYATVGGMHYVFGRSDIYVHDGMSKKSLAQKRIAKRLYADIDYDYLDRCFVYHDKYRQEIGFCYVSLSDDMPWVSADIEGCNRAALYNYSEDTWTLVDLPSAISWVNSSKEYSTNWDDMGVGWEAESTIWKVFEGQSPAAMVLITTGNPEANVEARPYFLDSLKEGRVTTDACTKILWDGYVEGIYKDLDELETPIYGRKMVSTIYPQFGTMDPLDPVLIKVGDSQGLNNPIQWGREMAMLPWTEHKYDTRVNGRYLSMAIRFPDGNYTDIGGYDLDVKYIAHR